MKLKLLTMIVLSGLFTASTYAQEYNLFSVADVDANGWIWFDTQAKIDKYVGEGKLIEIYDGMNSGSEVATIAADTIKGAGTDKLYAGTDHKTGAIRLGKSSGAAVANGGFIEMKLPSCVTFAVFLSSVEQMRPCLYATKDIEEDFVLVKSYPFTALTSLGQYQWNNMQDLVGNSTQFKSDTEIYVQVLNARSAFLNIHGMKVTTSTPTSTGVKEISTDKGFRFNGSLLTAEEPSNITVYSLTGSTLAYKKAATSMDFSSYNKGVYIVKVNDKCEKIVVRN